MTLTILTGTANAGLTHAITERLGLGPGARELHRFPDGELHVEIRDTVRGHDVFLVQPTSPPVESHLFELLLLADAARRAGAARVTAVIPYFGYARQDRRASGREPVSARVVADILTVSGIERVVAMDLHSTALEGVFGIPLEHVSAVPTLVRALESGGLADAVVVAPDLGATKLADRYARALNLPVAIVHKRRISGSEVSVRGLAGDVHGRRPIIVDDMISTGGTIEAAARALVAAGSGTAMTVVATHGLFVQDAIERLRAAGVERVVTTDTVSSGELPPWIQVATVAPLLAEVIGRLHAGKSLSDLISHG